MEDFNRSKRKERRPYPPRLQRCAQHCGQVCSLLFKLPIMACLAALPWAGLAETDWTGASERPDLPAAADLLAAVRERLPLTPITLKGRLLTGPSLRRLHRIMAIDTALELGAEPAFARYTLRDAFGSPAEELTIFRPEGGPARFDYRQGSPLVSSPVPSLYALIRNTDITWNDLSLSVLWAEHAATLGEEKIRGRDCYVLRATADAPGASTSAPSTSLRATADQPSPGYGLASKMAGRPAVVPTLRPAHSAAQSASHSAAGGEGGSMEGKPAPTLYLWVDKAMSVLLQIEERDAAGAAVRRLTVKSIKKIDDMWMMKNLEVRSLPSNHRTVLQIQEIQAEDGAIPLAEE